MFTTYFLSISKWYVVPPMHGHYSKVLFFYLLIHSFIHLFRDKFLLCIPGWSGSCYIAQVGLEIVILLPASFFWMLRVQACSSIPSFSGFYPQSCSFMLQYNRSHRIEEETGTDRGQVIMNSALCCAAHYPSENSIICTTYFQQ
jgi:hypothetical protein